MSSSDVADFFANKKKKKKTFKFNANKIDAGAVGSNASPPPQVDVSSTTISSLDADGGARTTASTAASLANLSLGSDMATTKVTSGGSGDGSATAVGEQWDDEALAAAITARKVVTASTITNTSTTTTSSSSSTAATARLLDMKAFDSKRNEQEDIAEKLRVEETKDQLKAAREGMEREAQRIREEQERAAAAAADSASGSSGRFIPPHLRNVGMGLMRSRMGTSNALDVRNEELFPDLAKADAKLMEQKQQKKQQQQQPSTSTMGPKRTPVGGNATWASRPLVTAPKQPAATTTAAAVVTEKVTNEEITAEDTSAATNTKADENTTTSAATNEPSTTTTKETLTEVVKQEEPTKDGDEAAATPREQVVETNPPEEAGEVKSEAAAAAAATKPKVKKKRKDVSTFKPSS